jgi:pentose-5-phosphate-3-epimerase
MLLPIQKRSDILNYITLKDESRYCFDSMKIMGIINVTPDSFYEKSRAQSVESAVNTAVKMINDGADFIDIGGGINKARFKSCNRRGRNRQGRSSCKGN